MNHKIAAGIVTLGLSTLFGGGVAGAHGGHNEVIPVSCDNNQTYEVVVSGNGDFTPGRDANGTAVFVPVSFGAFTLQNADTGEVVFSEPATSKGQSAKGVKNPVNCTFSFAFSTDGSEGLPAGNYTGGGSVVVRITPSS